MTKSFLTGSSIAVAAMIVFGAGSGWAASRVGFSFNAPAAGSPNSYIDFDDNNCTSTTLIAPSGVVTNGGAGLTLYGEGSLTGYGLSGGTCLMNLHWQGTGFGAFPGATGTVTSNVIFTLPSDVTITSCTQTVYINGTQENQVDCSAAAARGVFNLAAQSFPVPATLSTYEVVLAITAQWNDTALTTITVNVPGATSIDLLAQASLPGTPAPSSLILTMLGILLLAMMGFAVYRRKAADGV